MKTLIELECAYCETLFKRELRQMNKAVDHHYCSRECARNGRFKGQLFNCLVCNKEVRRTPGTMKKNVSGRVFCSKSCAATYNNAIVGSRNEPQGVCKMCPTKIKMALSYCSLHNRSSVVDTKTIGEYRAEKQRDALVYNVLRAHARVRFAKSDRPKICSVCQYKKHVEVAHIIDLHKFPDSATAGEANAESNLIGLCPTCHWEFDNDMLGVII